MTTGQALVRTGIVGINYRVDFRVLLDESLECGRVCGLYYLAGYLSSLTVFHANNSGLANRAASCVKFFGLMLVRFLAALPFGDEEDRKVAFKEAEDRSLAATAEASLVAAERYYELIKAHRELVYGVDRASLRHTLPIVAGEESEIPAVLRRSDGATLLYEGWLNSIFGEPGMAKSWVALMAVIQALRSGARVAWWDF